MKKMPILATVVLIASVLATSAFTHPLAVRNGVVRDYSAGKSLTIHAQGQDFTYALRSTTGVLPQNSQNGLGAGARVTVFAQCFGGNSSESNVTPNTTSNNASNNSVHNSIRAGVRNCIALAVLVRSPAQGGTIPATGGTGTTGTATPSTGAATGSATPSTGSTTGSATPSMGAASGTTTAMPTATTAATETSAATETPTPMCVTATATTTGGVTGTGTAVMGTPGVLCTPTPTSTP